MNQLVQLTKLKKYSMKLLFKSLFFCLYITTAPAQTISTVKLKISQDDYNQLISKFRVQGIKNETVKIQMNKFGQIISVNSKQVKLNNLLMETLLIPHLNKQKEIEAVSSILSIRKNRIIGIRIINFLIDTIRGQLYTAIKLSNLMNNKKYTSAENLFSKKQKDNIKNLKRESEFFNYWVSEWTMDEVKLERYIKRILLGHGNFIFEENEWKVNEN